MKRMLALCFLVGAACGGSSSGGSGASSSGGSGSTGNASTSTGPASTSGGSGGSGSGSSGGAGGVDANQVAMQAMGYKSFVLINKAPRMSMHALASTVNVWVPSDIAPTYRAIDPNGSSMASFDPGAMLVKEHLDAQGAFAGMTVMFKGPAGTNAQVDDWYWVRMTKDFAVAEKGAIGYCIGCHSATPDSDFAFGIPAAEQTP